MTGCVADCAIEVWPSDVKCMAYWKSLSRSRHPQIKSYEWLVECYSDPLVPAKLHFFSFVAGIFEPYLTRFQTCPHDSIYVQLTQCYLQKAGRPDQLLVC